MSLARHSSPLVFALLALTLAGCRKKETPAPDPSASAAPPIAQATATATASASAPTSPAPAPGAEVTQVRIALAGNGEVVYLQIKHPNARAADALNRELKAAADKRVSDAKTHAQPGVSFLNQCKGGFPSENVFWESCDNGSFTEGRRCPWSVTTQRVWSLAGAEPTRLDLKAEMTGDWIPAVDASCQEQFASSQDPWTTLDAMFHMNDNKPNWHPENDGLVLSSAQTGTCDPDRAPECTVPWDRLASFVKPGSPLKSIADKAPPGPKLAALEDRDPPPPPEDPQWRPSVPDDPEQKACGNGDQRACVKIAEALFNGTGVTPRPDVAQWMFWKACEAGEPTGCVNLGWSYLNDPQVEQAGKAAAPYFGKACKDNVVIGCLGLGTIYRDGRSTPKNPKRAADLFKQACDGGVKAACAMAKAQASPG